MVYLYNRIIQIVIVLVIMSFVIFMLIAGLGDPIKRLQVENPNLKPADIKRLKKQRGLDKPPHIRYFYWVKRIINGDIGYSITYKKKVESIMGSFLLNTLKLTIPVLVLSLLIAIPLGIITAVKQYSTFDYLIGLIAFLGFSVPTFVLGLLAIHFFTLKINILPSGGLSTPGVNHILDQIKYLILPVMVLSLSDIGRWVRYIRGTMLEVLKQDYIRTAKGKGLSNDIIIIKHALRNALIPFVTLLALSMPLLFSGALITEKVFGIHGMGLLLYSSIINQDADVAMASFLFISFLTLIFNLIADIVYSIIDPRIRVKKQNQAPHH